MDPNATWDDMVRLSKRLMRREEEDFYLDERAFLADVDALAEAVENLRWWLNRDGFAPDAFKGKKV